LFKIDSKLTKPGTSGEKGTGLGMILCKEFIEKLNGNIWIESEIGVGTSVFFTVRSAPIT
jgi:signal transduction histidine kinase